MKMKFMMALLVAMITVSATAQSRQRQNREFPAKEMISELKLSTEQVTALKEVDTKFQTAMRELRNQNDRTKMMEAMKAARTARLAGVKKALNNPEQYLAFLEYESINPMSGMGMGMGGNRQGNQSGQRSRNNMGGGENFGGGNFDTD